MEYLWILMNDVKYFYIIDFLYDFKLTIYGISPGLTVCPRAIRSL